MNEPTKSLPEARIVISGLLLLQAIAVGAWWVLLLNLPKVRAVFVPSDVPADSLLNFWVADLLGIVVVSLITALAVKAEKPVAMKLIWFLIGAATYAALYCLAESLRTDQAWISSAMMAAMAGMMWAIGTMHSDNKPELIREQRLGYWNAIGSTLFQVVFFWGILLWIVPKGILELAEILEWDRFDFQPMPLVGIILFAIASIFGLWSGYTMASIGQGTPLPTATAPELVLEGPYRFVRNPMALAGITQGLAVGLCWGSVPVLIYSICGAFFWHIFVRPYEEADLRVRFGDAYERYKKTVRLWLPTFSSPTARAD